MAQAGGNNLRSFRGEPVQNFGRCVVTYTLLSLLLAAPIGCSSSRPAPGPTDSTTAAPAPESPTDKASTSKTAPS